MVIPNEIGVFIIKVNIDNERIIDVNKYIDGIFWPPNITRLFALKRCLFKFIPETDSSHPWSMYFIFKWAATIGHFSINWDDNGTKNHIEHRE